MKKKIKFLLSERKNAVDIEISNTFSEKNINIKEIIKNEMYKIDKKQKTPLKREVSDKFIKIVS